MEMLQTLILYNVTEKWAGTVALFYCQFVMCLCSVSTVAFTDKLFIFLARVGNDLEQVESLGLILFFEFVLLENLKQGQHSTHLQKLNHVLMTDHAYKQKDTMLG